MLYYRRTSVLCALDAVRREAAQLGVRVMETELIGLIPEEAVLEVAREALQLPELPAGWVLERKL